MSPAATSGFHVAEKKCAGRTYFVDSRKNVNRNPSEKIPETDAPMSRNFGTRIMFAMIVIKPESTNPTNTDFRDRRR